MCVCVIKCAFGLCVCWFGLTVWLYACLSVCLLGCCVIVCACVFGLLFGSLFLRLRCVCLLCLSCCGIARLVEVVLCSGCLIGF